MQTIHFCMLMYV
nr:unnamed protein product [Callosobruchus analis]